MKNASAIVSTAKKTMLLESNTIANLIKLLDSSFNKGIKFINKFDRLFTTQYNDSKLFFDCLNSNNSQNFIAVNSYNLIKKEVF